MTKGFTLLEVVVATFIAISLMSVVTIMIVYFSRNYSFSLEQYEAIQSAQPTLTQIIREIREARSADNGAWPLEKTTDNELIFFSDVTGDSRTDRVRYLLSNGQLIRGVIEPTAVPVGYPAGNESIATIISNVNNGSTPMFTYYNDAWPGDTANNPLVISNRILQTSYIQVYLRLDTNPQSQTQPFELTSGVHIRSLKVNL